MLLVIMSSLLGAINFITTTVQLRAPGLTWFRLPFFVWAQFITAFLLLLAFPALQAAAVLQGMDRLADTSFFLPTGLVVSGQPLNAAGGGNALLWQHLFWFLAHPEVYVLVLPAMGIIAEIIANNTRKPLWGYRLMVYSLFVLGFLSFLVWAHHMFLTGMGTTISAFFQATTMIISIPSVVILSALILSLHGGSIRFNTPMLFALAFLPMFGIGGLTGLPLGLATTDIPLHDTNYVIAHFHYLVAPGTIFALFAGIYYWFPKATGRMMNETLGKIHFFGSLVCMNVIFMPMFVQGLAGVNRRLWDGGAIYTHAQETLYLNVPMAYAALALAVVGLAVLYLSQPAPEQARYVAVVTDAETGPVWLLQAFAEAREMRVSTVTGRPEPAGNSYELWMLPRSGANPVSLGLIAGVGPTLLMLSEQQLAVLEETSTLAISLEPAGGSPTGLPPMAPRSAASFAAVRAPRA